jgi:hypothetical protein
VAPAWPRASAAAAVVPAQARGRVVALARAAEPAVAAAVVAIVAKALVIA